MLVREVKGKHSSCDVAQTHGLHVVGKCSASEVHTQLCFLFIFSPTVCVCLCVCVCVVFVYTCACTCVFVHTSEQVRCSCQYHLPLFSILSLKFSTLIFILCAWIFCLQVYLNTKGIQCLQRWLDGGGSPGNGVTDNCESLCRFWEPNHVPSKRKLLLTVEAPLQHPLPLSF